MSPFYKSTLLVALLAVTLADIRIPPSITEEAEPHIIYRTDSEIVLPCVATGTPDPEYEWKRNGEPLEFHNNHQMSRADGTLTISPMTSLDDGYYQCIAKNDYGSTLSTVTFLERAVLSTYTDTTTAVYDGILGQPHVVLCYPTKSVPHPSFSWSLAEAQNDENPLPLMLSRRITTDEHGNLYFAHLTETDSRDGYLYKCNAFNPYMDLTTGGSYSTINVESDGSTPAEIAPTKLYSTESPRIALVGQEEVRLKCFFAGSPTPRVSFERAVGILPVGRTNRDSYDTELVISNVQEEDEGEYICRAVNAAGRSEDVSIFLDVQAAPMFHPGWQPVDFNATDGRDHTFNCKAEAEPEAEVQWMINGEPIDHRNPGPRMKVSDDNTALTITSVCKICPKGQTDLMVVQCNTSNVHGYAYASGYLNVLLATVITKAPEDVSYTVGTEEVHFDCKATSDDSTPVLITWEKDDARIYMEMDPRVTITATQLIINLKNLSSEDVKKYYGGEYMCVAENGYSLAQAKATLYMSGEGPVVLPAGAGTGDIWWIFLIIVLLLLLLILLLCCCICLQRNKGEAYPVDEKERANGNDPEKELADSGFHDYQRPEDNEPVKGSRASLTSTIKLDSDDEGSLNEYGDIDTGKFNEDGSFIGQYATDKRKRSRAADSTV